MSATIKKGSNLLRLMLTALITLFVMGGYAQSTANYTFATNATGSLALANGTAVDMSSGTTQLLAASQNAVASAVTNIGFDFFVGASRFTQFSVQDDGLVQLGATAVSTATYSPVDGTLALPMLTAFGADMRTGSSGKIHSKVFGTAPNRVLVIEFSNMMLFSATATAGTSTYQVRLYETTGAIEFVYGTMSVTDVSITPNARKRPSIGFAAGSAAGAFAYVLYAGHTSTTTGTFTANPVISATGDITNLTSTGANARRNYKYTPPVPAAPTGLTFSAVTATSMTLSWSAPGSTTNVYKYAVYRSSDGGATYSFVNTTTVGTNTLAVSGLTASTNYLWRVYSLSEGGLSTALAGSQSTSTPPVITNLSVPTGTCAASAHTVTADVTTAAGTISSVTLTYNNGSAGSTAMTLSSGNTYTGSIPAGTPGATVTWSITATNSGGASATANGTSYRDDPLTGINVVASANPASVCVGSPASLSAVFSKPVTTQVGSGTSNGGAGSTAFAAGRNFYGTYWGNARQQWLIRASELTALGFTAGNISALSITVNATGSPATLTGFTIKLAATTATTLTTAFSTDPSTTVWGPLDYTPVVGVNTHTFTNSFVWNGTSNLIVEVCHVNQVTGSDNATNTYSAPGFACNVNYGADGSTGAGACTTTTVSNASNTNRPNISLTANSAPAATGYSWSDGTNTVGSTNPLTVTPTGTTSYTATVTSLGCTKASNAVTITAIPLPAAPGPNNSEQCGEGVPAAFVTSGGGGGQFKWYSAQTGGTLLQTGGAIYTGSINSTTHFWVSESNGSCESARAEVVATVNQPDAVQASVNNNNPCLNTAITLTATNIAGSPTNNYAYNWSASPQAGSGLGAGQTPGNSLTVTPTAIGTYVYTLTATDDDCTTTSTVSITVKGLPQISTTSATPSTVCEGASVVLAATSSANAPGNVNIGAGAITVSGTTTGNGNPYNHYYGGNKTQIIYTKAELNAAGIAAGNITALATYLSALNTTTLTMNGFTINMGHTTQSAATTTLITTGLTQVYSNASQGVVVGANNYVFSTPFNWNNTDNIVVSICWSNNNSGSSSSSPTLIADLAPFTAVSYLWADATPVASLFAASTASSSGVGSTNSLSTTSNRPKVTFTAIKAVDQTVSTNWLWNPGAAAGSTVTVNPTTTTLYTVTATNPTTNCSNTATVNVNVNPLPPAPSGNNGTDQCGTGLTDASVSSNSGAASPVFKWYDAATGGNLLQSGTSTTYQTAITGTTTFYVSEISEFGCEGPRTEFMTIVSEPDALVVSATTTSLCVGSSTDISTTYTPLFNNYQSFTLTASPEAGSGITNPVTLNINGTNDGTEPLTVTPTATGTYIYTITAFDPEKGCTGTNTVSVSVGSLPTINSAIASPAIPVCAGTPVTLTATTNTIAAGNKTLGAGATTASSYDGIFYHLFGGNKTQFLVKASELSSLGIVPGNINSIGINMATVSSASYAGFAINIAHTTQTVMNSTLISTGFTQVYASTAYTPTTGINTFAFGTGAGSATSFNWDGTSNIVIQFCWSNNNGGGTDNFAKVDAAGFVACAYYRQDSESPATLCGQTAATSTTSNRPQFIFNAQVQTVGAGPYSWKWNPGNLSGNSVTVTPGSTTVYTATATFNGCSVNSNPVTVSILPIPSAPSVTPSTQCGIGTPAVSASGGTAGQYRWYTVSTGGTAIAGETNSTLSTSVVISTTTTYYVSINNGTCEGPRAEVVATVNQPDAVQASALSTSVCLNGTVQLSATNTASVPVNNYSYTWTANPATGSGIATSVSGSPVTITPTATGTYIYTVTAVDASVGCTTTATVSVTIKANPVAGAAQANPAVICSGGASTLSITVPGASSSIGTATTLTTAAGTEPTAFNNRFAQYWSQSVYTAAELQAAGLVAGNITAITFNVSTLGSAANNANFSIKIGTTATTSVAAFVTTGLTNVYGPVNYVHVVGLNTITFTTPYTWDGVSNLIIDMRHDGADQTNNARTYYTATTANTIVTAVVSGTSSSTTPLQTLVQNGTVTPALSTKRLNAVFNGQLAGGTGLNVTWNPGSLPGASVVVHPTATTAYTATVSDPSTGCSSTSTPVTVTVTPIAAAASATPSTPVCAGTSVVLNANPTGAAAVSYSWSNGTATVGTTNPLTVNPPVTTTYTVTVTDACSNTTTSSVTVTVNPLPTVSISETGPIAICAPATQTLTAVTNASSATYQWLQNAVVIPSATASTYTAAASGSYTVRVTENGTGCSSAVSAAVVVTINAKPSAVTVTPATTTICNGAIVTLNGVVSTSSVTTGTGASTSVADATDATLGPNPFQNYYGGTKQQMVFRASELTALGLNTGSVISAVKFNLPAANTSLALVNLRVKMKNTATSTLTTTWEPDMVVVRAASNYTPVVGINTIPLTTTFTWDGVSNLVLEVTYSNNNIPTSGTNTAKYSPTSFPSTIFYRVDSETPATLNTYTGAVSYSYSSRNDVTFDFSNPGSIRWSPLTGLYSNAGATTAYTGTVLGTVYAKPTTTTTYTATATSTAGCTNTATSVITVNQRPTGVLSGAATYCEGQGSTSTQLSIAVTGVGPWTGTLTGGIPFSGNTSPILVTVTPTATTTYTLATLNGSLCTSTAADLSGSATVTINPTPATPTISAGGALTFCAGGSVVLTSSSATGNQWNLDGSPLPGATNQALTVSASGDYTVTVTNGSNCSATSAITTVTVNALPATPTISAGGPVTFCEGGSVVLTSSSATGNQWNQNGSPLPGATNQSLTVTTSGNYTVTVTNAGNCSATSAITTVTVNPLAVNPTATVTQPTCTVATGSVTVTAPLGAGNSYTLDNTQTITWPAVTFTGVAPGVHTLTVTNSFGCSAPASASVTVDPQPFTPSAPTVTGIINVCPYINTGAELTYKASAPGATTYTWILPPNVVLVAGGTPTDSAKVRFDLPFNALQPNKQIRVTASSTCGTSAQTIYYLEAKVPVTPAPIVGPTSVCNLIGTTNTATYTISPTLSSLGYQWSLPSNATATHPEGIGTINDTIIIVTFAAGFNGGDIGVVATNGCGLSGTRTLHVSFTPAATPGLINGPTNVCAHIAPTGTAATYSIAPVPTASSYTWTAPAGTTITYPNGTGENGYVITVLYPAGFTSGTISVTATNGCGTSVSPRTLSVNKLNPGTPSNIDVIQTHFCGEAGFTRTFTYTVAAMPAGATSVQWTVPTTAGAVLVDGQGTTSITVTYPDAAVTGTVTAQAVNACAVSSIRSVSVKLPACPPPAFARTSASTANPKLPVASESFEVKLFPNPTVSDFKLEVLTSGKEEIVVKVIDNLGRFYKTFKVMPYQTIALGSELKPGSYLVEVRQGSIVKTTKVIKF